MRSYRGFLASFPLAVATCVALAACLGSDPDPVIGGSVDASTFEAGGAQDGAEVDAKIAEGAASEASTLEVGCRGTTDCERVLFVTKSLKTGNLGGATGADALCTTEANATGSHPRVHGREFVAWISVVGASAAERHVHGTKPYIRPDGLAVASDWTGLTSGTLKMDFGLDPFKASATGSIWTGSAANGSKDGSNCVNFSSSEATDIGAGGALPATDATWSLSASFACDSAHRVLCIEK